METDQINIPRAMKASEVLLLYQVGRRDFQHVNLRGQSFRKANLADADFSYADIRGTNFAQANLTGAKFTRAEAGLQKRWAIGLLIFAFVLITLSALFSAFASALIAVIFTDTTLDNTEQIIAGCVTLLTLEFYYWFVFRQGISGGGLAVLGVALYVVLYVVFSVVLYVVLSAAPKILFYIVLTVVLSVALNVVLTAVLSVALNVVLTAVLSVALNVVLTVVFYLVFYILFYEKIFGSPTITGIAITSAFTLITLGLNLYLAYRAYRGDERDAWVRSIGLAMVATGGTNFFDANLTDAYFSQAMLKNTNFRNAKLIRTCFRNSKKLDFARLGGTILAATPVRKLLVNRNGFQQDYTKADLRGANLDDANLETAILKYADLSEASLVGANLQAANLTETQAVGTNFTEAKLTGACIETWNTNYTTILDETECLWVYLAEKERKNLNQWGERRPSSGEFKPGEFTKLFTEILNTVDLIFDKGIDWRAFITAFKKAEAEENVSMHSIKNMGDGAIEVKLNVPPDADKEKIHSTFTQDYQLSLEAIKKEYEAKLAGKDGQIAIYREESARMERIVSSFASNQPKFINKTVMNDNTDQSQQLSVGGDFNIDGDNAMLNLQDVSGKVSNSIQQLPETTNDSPGIKELLTRLQTAIETETELTDKSKTKALKQVQKLAAAGENPQANQDDADDSLTMLKGIVSGLQETAKLATTCQEIIPLLTGLFGL